MLHLGCGQGTNTIFLGSKGLDIVGIDLSPLPRRRVALLLQARPTFLLSRLTCQDPKSMGHATQPHHACLVMTWQGDVEVVYRVWNAVRCICLEERV